MVKESGSVTGRKGLTVASSPLNDVKLDLGVILTVGVVLLLVQGRVLDSLLLQLLLLASYSLLGMIWIVVRTCHIMACIARERGQRPDGPHEE